AELWETLGYRAPGHGSNHLMYAVWPEATGIEARLPDQVARARQRVADVYQSVRLARNIKAEYRVPSGRKVRFFLKAAPEWIGDELETLTRLVHAEAITVDDAYQPAAGVPRILTPVGE